LFATPLFEEYGTAVASTHHPTQARVGSPQPKGRTVSVTVKDEMGSVIGANVLVKGTSQGKTTDTNGKVTLERVPDNAVLIVSYIGYVTQEVPVGGSSELTVTLRENLESLNEVVVVGFGTLERKQVTNAISSISADKMLTGVGGSDISAALQGKVSGLIMNNLGTPNSGTTFQLRGVASIKSGQSPLIVIDGFPGGDIRSLKQEDIKSIDVLKDASAGAIYGTRAAAGVIMITTKSGTNTNGKINLTYSGEFMRRQNYNAPDMLSGREYAEHGIGTDYGADTNWWDVMLNKSNFSQKHHIGINYGAEKTQVYAAFSYEKQEGISFKDGRQDYSGSINANFRLFDGWLEIKPNVRYTQAARVNAYPNFQQAMRNNPTRSPYDPESETGYNVWLSETHDYNTLADAMLSDYYGLDKWFQPQSTFKLNVKAIPGLSYTQIIGFENRQWEYHYYRSRYHRTELENSRKGTANLKFSKTENLTSQGYFTYVKDFKGGHSLNAAAGYDYFVRDSENFDMTNYNFSVDGNTYWNIGEGTYLKDGKADMSSGKSVTEKLMAYFARVNYSYKDRYLLAGSIRHEGSSKFSAAHRWGDFWSLSGAWRLSEEAFLKEIPWLDDLKARVSYGVTGNNDFSSTYMANLLASDNYWMLPNGNWANSYGKSQNLNPDLQWEQRKEWNFGLDFTLFGGRLYGKFDYFVKRTDNLIFEVKVAQPPFTKGTQIQNIGSMTGHGWELELGGDIIRKRDFTWSSSVNLSGATSRIKTLAGDNTYINGNSFVAPGSPGDAARIEAGVELGRFYLWKFAGFDDDGKFLVYNKDGEVIPADQKTENDKRYIGNYVPKVKIGWNHTFAYKNWDLGINLRSWIDFDVYNTLNMYYGIQGQGNLNVLKTAYTKFDNIRGEKQITDFYLEDGTFLKIDAITLGYTLPLKKYTKFIDKLRVYATVGNLACITGYSGMNPEVNVTGWDNGTEKFWDNFYPVTRTYTVGVKLNF
jgi:TonB-linked SusC/RagA family outer membrane protein